MAWKPDFRKKDPWEGMPPYYPGIATFVPTVEKPMPPWEGQVGAEAIPSFGTPAYQEIAQRITYTPAEAKPGIAGIDWSKWVVPAVVAIIVLTRRR